MAALIAAPVCSQLFENILPYLGVEETEKIRIVQLRNSAKTLILFS